MAPSEDRAGELLHVGDEPNPFQAYLQSLDAEQRARFERLRSEQPDDVRKDLVCADCGAPLALRLGRFGRFYGCEKFDETGCKGSVSAFENGAPKGIPGNAETRAARKKLVEKLNKFYIYALEPSEDFAPMGHRRRYQTICEIVGRDPRYGLPIGELDKDQCERALAALDIMETETSPTRWDLIRLGTLFPD